MEAVIQQTQQIESKIQKKRIRIAHLQLLPLITGVQKVTLDILTHLNREHYEPFIICQSPGPLTEIAEKQGIQCLFINHLVRPISPYQDMLALWQLTQLLRQYQFDILHTHSSKTGLIGRIAGRLSGVPAVMHTVHGYAFPAASSQMTKTFYLMLEWIGARFCDALICLKQADWEIAKQQLQMSEKRLCIIPNGIDTQIYRPLTTLERQKVRQDIFDIGEDVSVIAMIGRLWEQKNPLCFVKAADKILKKGYKTKFFLIGDGELREELDIEIKRLKQSDNIIILGWRDDVPSLLGAIDILALPSRWEGLPLTILEALSCGVPVVASDIPGNRDAISEGSDGLLAIDNDADSLADQIERLLKNSRLRKSYGEAGREKIIQKFQLDGSIKKIVKLYNQLVQKQN